MQRARPVPVSSEVRLRILASLPTAGEITDLDRSAQSKLAALRDVFRAVGRESVFEVKVVNLPYAAIGLHARAVVIITAPSLELLDCDELQALGAHEIAHEYIWSEYERAAERGDRARVKELELTCDGIAIMLLRQLGKDPMRLISALERVTHFNERWGTALNAGSYPTIAERRTFASAVLAWAKARPSKLAIVR